MSYYIIVLQHIFYLFYYTGLIFELKPSDLPSDLSIGGGGRYDNLTSDIGSKNKIPGVGFAMGDMVMEEILKFYNKYPRLDANKTKVLVTVFSPELFDDSLKLALRLRQSGVNCELYPDPNAKLDKQLKYADKKGIPFAVIIGPEEAASDTVTIKNLKTQSQKKVFSNSIASLLNS